MKAIHKNGMVYVCYKTHDEFGPHGVESHIETADARRLASELIVAADAVDGTRHVLVPREQLLSVLNLADLARSNTVAKGAMDRARNDADSVWRLTSIETD